MRKKIYMLALSMSLLSSGNIESGPFTLIGLIACKLLPSLPILTATIASFTTSYKIFEWLNNKEHRKTRDQLSETEQRLSDNISDSERGVKQSLNKSEERLGSQIKASERRVRLNLRKTGRVLSSSITGVGRQVQGLDVRLGQVRQDFTSQLSSVQQELQGVHGLSGATFRSVDDVQQLVRAQGCLLRDGQQELVSQQNHQRKALRRVEDGIQHLRECASKGLHLSQESIQALANVLATQRGSQYRTLHSPESNGSQEGLLARLRKRRGTTSLPCSSLQFAQHATWMHYAKSGQQAIAAWPTS